MAAQDQAINTRNYQKVICGQQVESKCRMCSQHEETVDHIVSGCEVLAKTEYISRHNNAAAYLHWSVCKDHDLKITDKWYQHTPETVIHNKDNNLTIMWDMSVNTDRTITANRPDIIVKDSVQRPRTRNTENVAYENNSDPWSCWCAWNSKEGDDRKHRGSIQES